MISKTTTIPIEDEGYTLHFQTVGPLNELKSLRVSNNGGVLFILSGKAEHWNDLLDNRVLTAHIPQSEVARLWRRIPRKYAHLLDIGRNLYWDLLDNNSLPGI